MTKLYELTERYLTIENMLEDEYITKDEIKTSLQAIEDEFGDKVSTLGKFVLELKSTTEAIKIEEDRLLKRRQAIVSNIEWLKNYMLTEMLAIDILKIKRDVVTVSVQDNPPSVELLDLEQVPKQYVRIIPEVKEPDKKAIAEHFKQTGEIVPGVSMILDKKHVVVR